MPDASKMLERLGPVSGELAGYFDSFDIEKYSEAPFGLLKLRDAVERSLEFRGFHPLAQRLSLVILDDAETSNHHGYIAGGPLEGGVLHLTHDGESFVAFDGLDSYSRRLIDLAEAGTDFQDYHYDHEFDPYVKGRDQQALATALSDLLNEPWSDKVSALAIVYIGALHLEPSELLMRVAQHEDFYLGEALANAILREPRAELLPLAEAVSKHSHFQAAEAGRSAMSEIAEAV